MITKQKNTNYINNTIISVFKFYVQTIADEKKNRQIARLFCPALYWFRFIRSYIKPEPNQTQRIPKVLAILQASIEFFTCNLARMS